MPSIIYILLFIAFAMAVLLLIGMCRASKHADILMEMEHEDNMARINRQRSERAGHLRAAEMLYGNGGK